MPDTSNDATNAAIISGASQLVSTAGSAYAQASMNRKTRKYNDQVYARTRADTLKDWATQNEYNSPKSQMQRFRDAGLNPNLIYGQTNTADPVRSSDTPAWNPRSPNFDLQAGPIVSSYFDTKLKEAQIDNLRAGITAQNQTTALTAAQTDKILQETGQSSQMYPFLLEATQENIRKTQAETSQVLDNNERQKALTANTLMQGLENIAKMRIETAKTAAEKANAEQLLKNLKTDNDLKQEDLRLRRQGINPSDPTWLRLITTWLEKLGGVKALLDNKPKFDAFKKF